MSVIPAPLQIPDFRAFWLARLTTTIGQMAMVIVIGWQVYDIARATMDIREAAFQLGLIGLVQFVPLFVLTPVSGWTADRLDRRHIARAVILLELLCALILFVSTWGGFISLPILFGVAALVWWLSARRAEAPGLPASQPGARALSESPESHPPGASDHGDDHEDVTGDEKAELERIIREGGAPKPAK